MLYIVYFHRYISSSSIYLVYYAFIQYNKNKYTCPSIINIIVFEKIYLPIIGCWPKVTPLVLSSYYIRVNTYFGNNVCVTCYDKLVAISMMFLCMYFYNWHSNFYPNVFCPSLATKYKRVLMICMLCIYSLTLNYKLSWSVSTVNRGLYIFSFDAFVIMSYLIQRP